MYDQAGLRDKCLFLISTQSGFCETDISELKVEQIRKLYTMPVNEHYLIKKAPKQTLKKSPTYINPTPIRHSQLFRKPFFSGVFKSRTENRVQIKVIEKELIFNPCGILYTI